MPVMDGFETIIAIRKNEASKRTQALLEST